MNIAIVSSVCNSRSGARAPIALASALSTDHQVTFIASAYNTDFDTYRLLKRKKVKIILIRKSMMDWLDVYKNLRRINPDIVSTHTTFLFFLGVRLTGIHCVFTYYGTQFNVIRERYLSLPIIQNLADFILNIVIYLKSAICILLAHQVVAISAYTAQEAKKLYFRYFPYIYLGGDFTTIPHILKSNSNAIKLLSVSRITPYKKFDLIISTVKDLNLSFPNIKLTLVGQCLNNRYLAYLRRICPNNVEILTDVNDTQLIKFYRNCDIYISTDKYLFFGLPLVEAAFFGKPAIVLDNAAAKEIVLHGKTGYLAKNPDELMMYLEKFILNLRLRLAFGENARKLANERFSWKLCAALYTDLFRSHLLIT